MTSYHPPRETVGPCTLRMSLQANQHGLALTLEGASVLGLSIPNFMLPRIHTLESERDGRYTFDVEATIAAFGLLVHYRRWLVRAAS